MTFQFFFELSDVSMMITQNISSQGMINLCSENESDFVEIRNSNVDVINLLRLVLVVCHLIIIYDWNK